MTRDTNAIFIGFVLICIAVGLWVGTARGDQLECSAIHNADQRAYCRAITSGDPLFCETIKDGQLRATCRAVTKKGRQ